MAKLYNLAAMTVASTGTGTITLGSAATINGVLFLSFAAAGVVDGETVAYSINDVGASEVGTGVYTAAGTTLSRTPVTSTNSNAAINMSAAAIVRISPAKADIANLRESNAFTGALNTMPKLGVGNAAAVTTLDVNANSSSSPAAIVATSVERVNAADGVSGGIEWTSYGAGTAAGIILAGGVAGGTAASPTASAISQYMFNMRGYGYNSGWQVGGLWIIQTAEAWGVGAQGTLMDWYTTGIGSTSLTLRMRLQASGGLTIGGTADYGTGNIAAPAGGLSTAPPTTKTSNYSMTTADSSLIFNGAGSLTLTLLAASSYSGRWLLVKTIAAQTVVSASSNVVPLAGGAAGTAILAATAGKWAWLQSDGTNWVIMASN